MKLERVNISVAGFAYICDKCFSESFRDEENKLDTIERFSVGECQLWIIENHGFLILSWNTDEKNNVYMEVEQGCGKAFYKKTCFQLLSQLADDTGSERIICHTIKPGVLRLLLRLGFMVVYMRPDIGYQLEYKNVPK